MEQGHLEQNNKNKVHHILAHSYSVYFILFLVGITLDLIFEVKLFTSEFLLPLGIFFLVVGSLLIVLAQRTSHTMPKENISKETFSRGPYSFTRHPTHWGLFLLTLGFGMMINATFVIISTVVSFLISKFMFVKKQEAALAAKYGAAYLEYKKSVRF